MASLAQYDQIYRWFVFEMLIGYMVR
jgi:hypothetical protein